MDGLPLSHHSLSLPPEYNYHHAMAQHAAVVSATNNSGLHSASMAAQIPMLSQGLNLSMNAGTQTMNPRLNAAAALGNNSHHHHLAHVGMSGAMHVGMKTKCKKPKVNKDGIPAPKRATTAYINFTQWYREDQKKNGRQIPKIGEFGKECAGKWNSMTSEEKQPFLDIAAQDRERYKKEMAIFKPARDVNKPKRPGTAFMLYMGDLRKEMAGREPEGGVAALAKLGGERWRGMTDDDKRKYVEKQGEEKLRYEQNMEEYRRKQSADNMQPVVKQPRLDEASQDSSNSLETPTVSAAVSAAAASQLPQLMQHTSNSGSSSGSPPHSNAGSPASQASSPSPPPPTLSPGPTVSAGETGQSSMAALSSLANPMSLTHAMAMEYVQHTLSDFAHASGMLVPNFNQAHAHNSNNTSSTYPASSYNQPHLPGPYSWT